jgi:hypothetical protein
MKFNPHTSGLFTDWTHIAPLDLLTSKLFALKCERRGASDRVEGASPH